MHNNIYEAILQYSTLAPDLFFFKVNELLPEVFEPLHKATKGECEQLTIEERKTVVLYICHAYSRESEMIIGGITEERNKSAIATYVGLPDYLRGPVLLLKDKSVTQAVINYLEVQKERDWHHLNIKKMQYTYLMDKSVLDTLNSDGKADHKFIVQCGQSADELLKSINEFEDRLKAKYKSVDGAMEQVQKVAKEFQKHDGDDSLTIESAVRNKNKNN